MGGDENPALGDGRLLGGERCRASVFLLRAWSRSAMIFVDAPPEEWSVRYELPIVDELCQVCRRPIRLDRPFRMKGYAGFTAEAHGCGPNMPILVVPISDEEKALWSQLF